MNRRDLVRSGVAGAGGLIVLGRLAQPVEAALVATDDELAYANFGLAAELLLDDFWVRTGAAGVFAGAWAREQAAGVRAAREHVGALSDLLSSAGQTAAVAEDFSFSWPAGAFARRSVAAKIGGEIARAAAGAYLSAVAAVSTQSYRVLYGALAASLSQQIAVLSRASGRRGIGNSFPASLELEPASVALDRYFG